MSNTSNYELSKYQGPSLINSTKNATEKGNKLQSGNVAHLAQTEKKKQL